MGMLRDILDTVRDINAIGSVEEYFKTKKYSSISKRSLEGTLQFPVIVSRSLDIDTLQMICKALERQFSTFVQISLSMDPMLRLDKEKDVVGYLKKFHQNSGVKTDLHDVMNVGTELLESSLLLSNDSDTAFMLGIICEGSTTIINNSNKDQLGSIYQHVRTDNLNSNFIPKKDFYNFPDKNLSDYHNGNGMRPVTEAPNAAYLDNARWELINGGNQNPSEQDVYRLARDSELDYRTDKKNAFDQQLAIADLSSRTSGSGTGTSKLKGMDIPRVTQNILKDNDVKKSNELIPTTLHIKVSLLDSDSQQQGFIDFIIGVKSTMHPVTSAEMVTNVVGACKNNSKIFNFIRWTTGETNFFKDFLFNMQEIKDDVVNRSAGSSGWWITLKRRRALAKMKSLVFMPGQILPNASIVMSLDEVEHIKSEFGYNLMDTGFADKIMKEYFLLSLVVVDNSAQIAHFLFDGQTSYQSYTFGVLEKENTNKADIKEVMKIINRSNMV